jgi:predicted small integral membrane protein
MDLSWMAWTPATAAFFAVIAALLVAMTVWGAVAPQAPRRGVLRIETTPGDRLFISLLGSAFIHLGWLAAFGAPLWGALAVSLVWAAAVFRWV